MVMQAWLPIDPGRLRFAAFGRSAGALTGQDVVTGRIATETCGKDET